LGNLLERDCLEDVSRVLEITWKCEAKMKNNITVDLREIGLKVINWNILVQDNV
jgi:hypothetical protein